MNRKLVRSFNTALLIILQISQAQGSDQEKTKRTTDPGDSPSVVLITIDTLRADHLGAYGYSRNTSPNIDAFAKKGVIFSNAICNWPKTTPSFVSMLTGTYGATNLVRGGCRQPMPLELITIAEVFERNGFRTGAVSNNANLSIEYHFDQGFQDFVEIWEDEEPSNCETVTKRAIDWLEKSDDTPFFLWVHYVAPHTLYTPSAPYDEMFIDDEKGLEANDRILPINARSYVGGIDRKRSYIHPFTNLNDYISKYDGEIAYVDSEVGKLLDRTDTLEQSDNIIFVITSDHGEELGEHGLYFEHGSKVQQSTMKVPLFIVYPRKIPAGKIVDQNVSLIGLFPTLVDYTELDIPQTVEGKSLSSLISSPNTRHQAPVFSEGGYRSKTTKRFHSVVYDKEWKLIHGRNGGYQLYNLSMDPTEQINVIEQEKRVAKRLRRLLTSWESEKGIGTEKKKPSKKNVPSTTNRIELSDEAKAQLEALGYMESN